MSWRVEFRPEVELDVAEAAAWYEARQQDERVVIVAAVLHAARHDREWKRRL